jgi:hypothetical protein
MRRICPALLVSTVLMAAAPATSFGQALPSDPEADSPSGVVYELPVDRARNDAAPRGGAGSSDAAPEDSGAVAGTTAGSIRSENNFGTSSEVPGAPSKRARPNRRGRDDDTAEDVPALTDVARVAPTASATTDGPADGVVFPLLAVLLAVGAGIGAVAGGRSLRNRRGD